MPQQQRIYSVYMLASKKNGTLYIGVTSDLATRIIQHKEKQQQGFSSLYNVSRLVWWEDFEDVQLAIQREKTMKKWVRQWKVNVIEATNPNWLDLTKQALGVPNISSVY
jgi:putative endonuclease